MGKNFLIDTNILINYLLNRYSDEESKKLSLIITERFFYSFITRIELLGFRNLPLSEAEIIFTYLSFGNEIIINENIIQQTIEIRKTKLLKIPDAIIAATAIIEDYTLLTNNIKDFRQITGLKVQTLSDNKPAAEA